MATDNNATKRIAKNTGILYMRMIFLMLIGLYTSRVILQALGVDNYGIYNVVGGFVAMFHVLSKSLTSASTRFINYEIGKGNKDRLSKVFSTSLTIQILLAIGIGIICEIIGVWYVNNVMVIDPNRLYAANWVFQFSIITFCSTLITVPYNAAIIAHERMKAFAYVSLFDGIAKLAISYAVMISPVDVLIFYAALICILQLSIQGMYRYYCHRNFQECSGKLCLEKTMVKNMAGYAGWTFIGTSASVLRNQGGNVLINLFFGTVVNAARGVANQVLHAVSGFVTNFTMALDPQITQNYASGNHEYMMKLVYVGARLSYYMLLILCLPIIINADYILHLWLKEVPDHAVTFTQLTLVFTMIEAISHPLIKAQQATGRIRNYQLVVGGLNLLNLPICYVIYKMGGIEESFLIVAILCSIVCLMARIYMLRTHVKLNVRDFLKNVLLNIVIVSAISLTLPVLLSCYLPQCFWSLCLNAIVTFCFSCIIILFIGCNSNERVLVYSYIYKIKRKIGK